MKKIIITTCAILMMSVTANACGGITIKGNSGADYCLSKQAMNWYSAYAWCKDQGMELIDLGSVCKTNKSDCLELMLSSDEQNNIKENGVTVDWVWTNMSSSAPRVYYVHLALGDIADNPRNHQHYALCY